MKKKLILLTAVLMVLVPAALITAQGKPVTIQFFSGFNEGEPYVPLFKQIIADFEAATPNIKVNATWNGRENLTKVRPMLLSGNVPEIMDQGGDELTGALVNQDLTFALDKELAEAALGVKTSWKSTFKPGQLETYMKGSQTHIIPWWIDTTDFFYNGKLFGSKGYTVPKTWEDFLALGAKLKAGGLPPLAQDGGINFYNVYYFRHFVQRILGNGALPKAAGDKTGSSWDNPGFLKAAKMVEQLTKKRIFHQGLRRVHLPGRPDRFREGQGGDDPDQHLAAGGNERLDPGQLRIPQFSRPDRARRQGPGDGPRAVPVELRGPQGCAP